MGRKSADRGRGLVLSLLKNRTGSGSGCGGGFEERLRRCVVQGSPAGGGLYPEGFVAPPPKVSTFSLVAPCLVEKCLAALPIRVYQQAPTHEQSNRVWEM